MNKPAAKEDLIRSILQRNGVKQSTALVGVRGYFRDTLGVKGVNDAGIYDDAIFLVYPGGFKAFNGNTDPSRIGWNREIGKPFAQLKCGVWPFIKGLHKGRYEALRQPYEEQAIDFNLSAEFPADDPRGLGHFTVIRNDGKGNSYQDTAYHAINIHRGGTLGTSSWGCQTIPPDQYGEFISSTYKAMRLANQRWLPYCLVEGPIT